MKREEFTYQTNTGEFVAEKLLPCPFCGGEPEFVTIGNDYTKSRKAEIKCTKCFCKRTTGAIHNNLEWCGRKAIELWNKRTADLSLPPAEGAEQYIRDKWGESWLKNTWEAEDVIEALTEFAAQPQPTAEGAEEMLEKYGFKIICHKEAADAINDTFVQPIIAAMQEYATLHAQRFAEKTVEERMEQYKAQFKDRPNPRDVNPYDSKGIKRICNRKIR